MKYTFRESPHFREPRWVTFGLFVRIVILLCLTFTWIGGCDNFSILDLLKLDESNQSEVPLAISPINATISVGMSMVFIASGGDPPYKFDIVSGLGTIEASTGRYTAPDNVSEDRVRVVDALGSASEALVVVVD